MPESNGASTRGKRSATATTAGRWAKWVVAIFVAFTALGWQTDRAAAQVPATIEASETVWEIRLTDGSVILGRVIRVDSDALAVVTQSGATVEIPRATVGSMRETEAAAEPGEFVSSDPNRTRLLFGPTGRAGRQGDAYVGVYELFFPFLSYSVTDWLTIAGGTPVIPGLIGEVFYVAPRVGFQVRPTVWLSAGVLAFQEFRSDADFSTVGILYGAGTFGNDDEAITLGVGFGFAGDEVESRPVAMLGFEQRSSERIKFISENYLVTYEDSDGTSAGGAISGGVRIIAGQLSADAGLGIAVEGGGVLCCLPLVNFVYHF